MFSVNTLMAVIQLSYKIFSTLTLRKLGTLVMKIASLKTKVKCSVSQFQLEWCNKQEEVWAEKTLELSISRQEEEGVGPGRTGWSPHSRWVRTDCPAAQPWFSTNLLTVPMGLLPLQSSCPAPGAASLCPVQIALENLDTSAPTKFIFTHSQSDLFKSSF